MLSNHPYKPFLERFILSLLNEKEDTIFTTYETL